MSNPLLKHCFCSFLFLVLFGSFLVNKVVSAGPAGPPWRHICICHGWKICSKLLEMEKAAEMQVQRGRSNKITSIVVQVSAKNARNIEDKRGQCTQPAVLPELADSMVTCFLHRAEQVCIDGM